jgi:hypothetical protein
MFKCFECTGLNYRIQSLEPPGKALHRARKIRERLHASAVIGSPVTKPHRMRWATFRKLEQELKEAEKNALRSLARQLLD